MDALSRQLKAKWLQARMFQVSMCGGHPGRQLKLKWVQLGISRDALARWLELRWYVDQEISELSVKRVSWQDS